MIRTSILMVTALILLSACSSQPTSVTVPYNITIGVEVAEDANPYGNGDSHPVVLRLYQLTEISAFQNTGFLDLYNDDRKLLGSALVDVLYLQPLVPGTQQQIEIDLQRQARYLAVLAEFADYANASTKAVIKIAEQPEDQPLAIRVSGLSVAIVQVPEKSWWQIF